MQSIQQELSTRRAFCGQKPTMNDSLLGLNIPSATPAAVESMKGKKSSQKSVGTPKPNGISSQRTISAGAHALASIGPITEAVVNEFLQDGQEPQFFAVGQEYLKNVANALQGWSDETASKIVREYIVRALSGNPVDIERLLRWIRIHSGDLQSVLDCINIDPPTETEITSVLSRSGSHKLVFLAIWRDAQKQGLLHLCSAVGAKVAR